MTDVKEQTPKKRKSLAPASPASAKKNKPTPGQASPKKAFPTPKKNQTPNNKTPNPNKKTPKGPLAPKPSPTNANGVAKNPKQKTPNPKQNKAKPASPAVPNPAAAKAKKQKPGKKLEKFAGTGDAATEKKEKTERKKKLGLIPKLNSSLEADKEATVLKISNMIAAIEGRDVVSKSGRSKIKKLKNLLKTHGVVVESTSPKTVLKVGDKLVGKKNVNKAAKKAEKAAKKAAVVEKSDDEEEDDDEDEEEDDSDDDDESSSEEAEMEVESAPTKGEAKTTEVDKPDQTPEAESSSDEEPQETFKKPILNANEPEKKKQHLNQTPAKPHKSRYVLFAGNLDFAVTKQELIEHFKSAGEVISVRIPLYGGNNLPRGFAYIEFANEEAYQKGFKLHHSFMKNRRINVEYTQSGKKKTVERKNEIKKKNFKMHSMMEKGQFGAEGNARAGFKAPSQSGFKDGKPGFKTGKPGFKSGRPAAFSAAISE